MLWQKLRFYIQLQLLWLLINRSFDLLFYWNVAQLLKVHVFFPTRFLYFYLNSLFSALFYLRRACDDYLVPAIISSSSDTLTYNIFWRFCGSENHFIQFSQYKIWVFHTIQIDKALRKSIMVKNSPVPRIYKSFKLISKTWPRIVRRIIAIYVIFS